MGDIVKDLNMIDFLGMILPGSLLLLLFGQETGLWVLIGTLEDQSAHTLATAVILVLGGYIVGMILHEIGDWVEKLLWHNPLLNPRTYAAIQTGFILKYQADSSRKEPIKRAENNAAYIKIMYYIAPVPAACILWIAFMGWPRSLLLLCTPTLVVIAIGHLYTFTHSTHLRLPQSL